MFHSSISSSDQEKGRKWTWAGVVTALSVALLLVGVVNAALLLDPFPKALPFHDVRCGTLVDYVGAHNPRNDIAFMGNSQCLTGIRPAVFEKKMNEAGGIRLDSFNYGTNGIGMPEVAMLFQKCFCSTKPKHLVVLISPFQMKSGRVEAVWASYGMRYWAGQLSPFHGWLMKLPLFRYRRLYRDTRYLWYALTSLNIRGDLSRRLGEKGFVSARGRFLVRGKGALAVRPNEDSPRLAPRSWSFGEEPVAALQDLARVCRENDVKLTVVIPPHRIDFHNYAWVSDETWNQFVRGLRTVFDDEVTVLDLHRVPGVEQDMFFDQVHLNAAGAKIFSTELAGKFIPELENNKLAIRTKK